MRIAGRPPMTALRDGVRWADDRLPWGIRTAAGCLLMVGGVFGFLPILGFWMLPLGAALVVLDVPFLRHRLLERLDRAAAREREPAGRGAG